VRTLRCCRRRTSRYQPARELGYLEHSLRERLAALAPRPAPSCPHPHAPEYERAGPDR